MALVRQALKAVRTVAEAAASTSREPPKPKAKKQARTYRTGNIQLNAKVRGHAHNDSYRISDAQGWVLGEKSIFILTPESSFSEFQGSLLFFFALAHRTFAAFRAI